MDESRDSRRIPGAGLSRRRTTARLAAVGAAVALAGMCMPAVSQPLPPGPGQTGTSEDAPILELVNLDILDSRDGFAILPDSPFLPGERVHVYFQIKGYRVGPEDRVLLRYELSALDPVGRRFYAPHSGTIDEELAPQDENWMPVVRYSPRIPDHAGGGTFAIHVTVHDDLAGTSVEADVPVNVQAETVDRADELLVREFRFSRAEGGDPLAEAEFRPGEEIWAAFYITGYESRANNTFDVESDAWVVDSDGERLYAFDSRSEQGRPYYPRLWLPARLRLDLDDTISPGRYTVVLRLRDRVGGSESTQRYQFRIR